jgi:hypothetical protein
MDSIYSWLPAPTSGEGETKLEAYHSGILILILILEPSRACFPFWAPGQSPKKVKPQ